MNRPAQKVKDPISVGDLVVLDADLRTGDLRGRYGQTATVLDVVTPRHGANVIKLSFPDGAVAETFPAYLRRHVAQEAKKRRSPLHMKVQGDDRSEAERQRDGEWWLTHHGYSFQLLGQARKAHKCSECGHAEVHGGYVGNTPGAPDMLVFRDEWAEALGLMVEWKASCNAHRSPEQKVLEARRRITVVWDTPMLKNAVARAEDAMGLPLSEWRKKESGGD